jgi:hypothetical protein
VRPDGDVLTQDQPSAGRPRRKVDQVSHLGNPGPRTGVAVGLDRGHPTLLEVIDDDGDPGVEAVAEGESQPTLTASLREQVGGTGRIRTCQPPRTPRFDGLDVWSWAGYLRQRVQRSFEHGDVVDRGIRPGIPFPQQPRQRFTTGDVGAVQER